MSVYDKLHTRMTNAYYEYIMMLNSNMPSEEIACHSHETVCKEAFMDCYAKYGFSEAEAQALAGHPNPLDYLYLSWTTCKPGYIYEDELQAIIEASAKMLLKKQPDIPPETATSDIMSVRDTLCTKMTEEEAAYHFNLLDASSIRIIKQSHETAHKAALLEYYRNKGKDLGDAETRALAELDKPLEYLYSRCMPYFHRYNNQLQACMAEAIKVLIKEQAEAAT
jgi:hypothetical protein